MPEPAPSPEALTELLERFPLERPGSRTFEEVADAQVRFLTARIAALTDMLRGAEPNETVQLASRILLGDLTALSAHFRGRANTMRSSLGKVVADLRAARHASSHGERD